MATAPIYAASDGRINIPTGPFLDARGNINPAWQLWLLNPNVQSLNTAAPVTPYNGGLGVSITPVLGQLPVATTSGVYVPSDFTSLPLFTSTSPGLAPASGGGTKKFLRADTTFASPVAGSAGQVQYNSSSAFAASSLFTYDGAGLLGVSNITGTALGMTVQPKAPTVLETGLPLTLVTPDAAQANTAAASINLTGGAGLGNGAGASVNLSAGASPAGTGGGFMARIAAGGGSSGTGNLFDSLGNSALSWTDAGAVTKLAFYGATMVPQATAYTLTYNTAARVVPAATAANVVTTASTLVAYGFTQAQADSIPVAINATQADVVALKKLIVALINDLSKTLGVGLNAT
jgi:hypothetical protein